MDEKKIDTEYKIIEAAKSVFVEKGLQGARMQEIADKAGINKALLHYYFRSKDKLFDAIFESILHKLVPEFSRIIKEDQPLAKKVEQFVGFYNDFFKENPFLPQFFFHEIWQHPDKLANFIKSQSVNPLNVVETLQGGVSTDESKYAVPHLLASILGMTIFPHIGRPLFQRMFFDNNDTEYNSFLDERTDFITNLLVGSFSDTNSSGFGENPSDDF